MAPWPRAAAVHHRPVMLLPAVSGSCFCETGLKTLLLRQEPRLNVKLAQTPPDATQTLPRPGQALCRGGSRHPALVPSPHRQVPLGVERLTLHTAACGQASSLRPLHRPAFLPTW